MKTSENAGNIREESANAGCAVSVEIGEDGKLIISVDVISIIEGIREAASWGDISDEFVEYVEDRVVNGLYTFTS
jgi:hypothetical protein